MKRKAAREEEDFKNRINPGGVYTAHRDSDGKQYVQTVSWVIRICYSSVICLDLILGLKCYTVTLLVTKFSEYEIVYDDNSSQELDDDDVEHLIEEGQNEIEEESDQVYSSQKIFTKM